MSIFLAGGGTGGPTAFLLAIASAVKKARPESEFFLLCDNPGLPQKLLEELPFPVRTLTIPAGKWRRPFSLWNLTDGLKTLFGFLKSLYLIRKYRAALIIGSGSFVQVPVVWAGFFSRVPALVHQPDLRPLLSTRLTGLAARAITVGFSGTAKELPQRFGLFSREPKSKVFVTGNPVREEILRGSSEQARGLFGLNPDYPTVLVMGGGTGAANLNQIVLASLPELLKYVQVIHLTGGRLKRGEMFEHPHYHAYDFLGKELKHALAAADLVVSRGGMSAITELSVLGKLVILVPLPESPQEDNVQFLVFLNLAIGVRERQFTPELFLKLVRKILWSREIQATLPARFKRLTPKNAARQIARIALNVYNQSRKPHGK